MKTILVYLVVSTFFISSANAQDIPANHVPLIDDFILKTLVIEKTKIESDTLAKVFNGSFYEVTPTYYRNGAKAQCERYRVVIKDGKLSELEGTEGDQTFANLFSLLKEGFTLKNETDAKIFEAALDHIYPFGWPEDPVDKKILKQDGRWLFLRGDFMGSKKGFIVTIEANGKISQIDYNLEAVKLE
ncbi:MAG TPA: hypothetical protein VI583_02960 [Cyclobacteriaceae bacterium]|nr:hypothetical protein [Cyclobacteriaceae bacterium]